jgi:hypothetical protein
MAMRNNGPWLTIVVAVVLAGLAAAAIVTQAGQDSSAMAGAVFLGLIALPVAVNAALTNLRDDSGRSLLETIVERRRASRSRNAGNDVAATGGAPPPGSPAGLNDAASDDIAAYRRGFLDGLQQASQQRAADASSDAGERLLTAAEWRDIEADQQRSDIRFAAWLGAAGAVLAALVGGVFLVIVELIRTPPTP